MLYSAASLLSVIIIVIVILCCVTVAFIALVFIYIKNAGKKGLNYPPDPTTGLMSMEQFKHEVREKLITAKSGEYCLISIDIDNFKHINNSFDCEMGNNVLRWFAGILSENESAIVSRNYADEFIVFFKAIKEPVDDMVDNAVALIRTESESYKKIDEMLGGNYSMHFSLGYYEIIDQRESLDKMLDSAQLAKKKSKETYGTCITKYDLSMHLVQNAQKEIIQAMEKALIDEEFVPFIQPKFSLKEHELIGAEALARWVNPRKGTMTPVAFIPLFEKNGFIVKLDLYMFRKTCEFMKSWREKGKKIPPISINFSRITLISDKIVEKITAIAKENNIPPSLLEIELTETVIIENFQKMLDVVGRIKQNGFSVSMDDFGSGYSSLNKLKDLPVDILKIDKGFLNESIDSDKGKKIVGSVISMSKILGLITVAEGVETQEQADSLLELGCDNAQGFLFAPPMHNEEFEKLLN